MTDTLPIDSLMIDRWTNQWTKQLGFNDEQILKRNNKVEQFSRVCSFVVLLFLFYFNFIY